MSTSNGTSMAAPFVAGLAALAMRESPQLSAYQIRGVILSATDSSAYLNGYSQNGGRLNALKAIQIAQAQVAATTWAPSYSPVYKIEASSESAGGGSGGAGGCGLVKALVDETQQGPPSGGQMAYAVVVGLLMLMPLVMALKLRRSSKNYVRQYERFTVAKDVVIQIGDQVVNVASQTLAVGGLSFKSDQPVFEKGQKIKLKINDVPEEIEGEIVWSSSLNSFGVKFTHVTESLKAQVQGLTAGLMPT